ncbi:MAG: hypothetical protein EOP56_04830 [Sphingobacteriales bacterium]|nr:MAG: hypothetical protein EOP56_04830 [Sphingobacteriales bacterium]
MKIYQVIFRHTEQHRDLPVGDLGYYTKLDKAQEKALQKVNELNSSDEYSSSTLTKRNEMEWYDGYYTYVTIHEHQITE